MDSAFAVPLTLKKFHTRLYYLVTTKRTALDQIQINEYKRLLKDARCTSISTNLKIMFENVIEVLANSKIFLTVSREVLNSFVIEILPTLKDKLALHLANFILYKISYRKTYFDQVVASTYLYLYRLNIKEKKWKEGLQKLICIPFESEQIQFSMDLKMEIFIRIVHYYLEENNPILAEFYVMKAARIQFLINNENLGNWFKVYYARVLDHRCMFIDAAREYYEVFCINELDALVRLTLLKAAFICTVLSPSNYKRFKMLKQFYDEDMRYKILKMLPDPILKKLCLGHLIQPDDIEPIRELLMPYHKEIITDNCLSLLTEALVEHNIFAVSKLYKCIKMKYLVYLWKIDQYKIEKIARKMISEKRIKGLIDHIDGFIYFKCSQNVENSISTFNIKFESVRCHENAIIQIMFTNSQM